MVVAARGSGSTMLILLVAVSLISGGAAIAQAPPQQERRELTIQDLMGMKVSVGSLEGTDLLSAPSVVSVIDSNTIREFNFQSVSEALDMVAGFSVMRTYLKRDVPTARGVLQDHYANKVLILINNVPTWNAVTGEGILARIDIHDVDRIEVLKGPASVLYGTNAYVGAVNIVLKSPQEHRSEVQMGIAEHFGFVAGGNVLWTAGETELLISANATDAIGGTYDYHDEANVVGKINELMTGRSFTLHGKHGAHAVLLNAYSATESYLGTNPLFSVGAGNDQKLKGALANYTYTTSIGRAGVVLGLTYDWNNRDISRTNDDLERGRIQGYRVLGSAKTVFELFPGLNLQGGIDWERRTSQEYSNYLKRTDRVLAFNNMRDRSVEERAAFAQLVFSRPRVRLLVGTRYTDNELFGSNVSSRATLVYVLSSSSNLKLMAGQSYRVPSLFELYFQTPTNTVYGNTALKPEINDTIELAYTGNFGSLLVEAVAYHARYEDKIYRERRYPRFVSDPKDKSTIYINGEAFAADGVEIETRYRFPKNLSAFANCAYVDGDRGDEVPGTGHYNFKYVPHHTFAAGLVKYLGNAWVAGVARYRSSAGAPIEPIDSEVNFDLTVGIGQRLNGLVLRHLLSAKNVGNQDVRFPEYVRRTLNDVSWGYDRRISYTVQVGF